MPGPARRQSTGVREAFVKFGNPDFVRYAKSFGARGYRVEAADDLPYIPREAFVQSGPVVIDCPVDYSENLTLTEPRRKQVSCLAAQESASASFVPRPP